MTVHASSELDPYELEAGAPPAPLCDLILSCAPPLLATMAVMLSPAASWRSTTVTRRRGEISCPLCCAFVEKLLERGRLAVDDAGDLVVTPGD